MQNHLSPNLDDITMPSLKQYKALFGTAKWIKKKHINFCVKDDWMSQACWKSVKFTDIKDCGKRELLMINSGIDASKVL